MTDILLCLMAILLLANLAVTAALYIRLCLPSEEQRSEAAVEKALRESADPMDEGFENIMRFSVNGKTGFETE